MNHSSFASLYVRYFFPFMSIVFIAIALMGFSPSYSAMRAGQLSVGWFVHVHGALMGGWLLILFVQSSLVSGHNVKSHRRLGQFSVVVVIAMVIFMLIVSLNAIVGLPPRPQPISISLSLIQLPPVALFILFVTISLLNKRNAHIHKRMMYFATLAILTAAFGRISWLHPFEGPGNANLGGFPNPSALYFYQDLLLIPLILYDIFSKRSVDRITMLGSTLIVSLHLCFIVFWGNFN